MSSRTSALPDLPRWVEAHGIARALGDGDAFEVPLATGFAIGTARGKLVVASPDADAASLVALADARADHAILVADERADLAAALRARGRSIARVLLHTLADPEAPSLAFEGAAPLPPELALPDLPAELADELAASRAHGRAIWAAWLDGAAVAFAHAPWQSATWFDVAVEVLPAARQLGLGTIVAAALIADERARGRQAVWGAAEDHVVSRRMAARLGFVAVDAIVVAA